MRKLVIVFLLGLAVTGCGSEYDPDLCALWTDTYHLTESGTSRVEMDRYCTR